MSGQHAKPAPADSRRSGFLRALGVTLGLVALGLVALVGGVAFGSFVPWGPGSQQAVASMATPSPETTPSPRPTPTPSPSPTVEPVPAPTATVVPEPAFSPLPDRPDEQLVVAYGDPAVVSSVYPSQINETYGVGIVIRIEFGYPVSDRMKEMLERTAVVETSQPIGPAAWSWPDDYTMAYRPKDFWPSRTDVKVKFDWVDNGLANMDPEVKFYVGRSQILTVKHDAAMGKLKRDGVFLRNVPVSLGKAGWATGSGVKSIMERYAMKRMVNPGPLEPYDVNVPYALRLTPSGEFLHAAPWNEYNLGYANTSHGCTNVSYVDGQWFYENALEGDPVITTGTGVDIDWYEGPGAMFNIPWEQWLANSRNLP